MVPSSEQRLKEVLSWLPADGVTYRIMMGEYIIYYREKVVGGIYDDRFLVKPTKTAKRLLPDAPMEIPYDGAKPMIMVEDGTETIFLQDLLVSIWDDLYGKKGPDKGYHR